MNNLEENLKDFKKSYFKRKIFRGVVLFVLILSSAYLFFSGIEFFAYLQPAVKVPLVLLFFVATIFALFKLIAFPLYQYFHPDNYISDEQAASEIGKNLPDVKDKLLNTVQLLKKDIKDDLINASISQKKSLFKSYEFGKTIDFRKVISLSKWIIIPTLFFGALMAFSPDILTESTTRLIKFDKKFEKPLPFSFHIKNDELKAFANEEYTLELELLGNQLPENVHLLLEDNRQYRMSKEKGFSYTFQNLNSSLNFKFKTDKYESDFYHLKVVNRPVLENLKIDLAYPTYTRKKKERIENIGDLVIPQGTNVKWILDAKYTEDISFNYTNEKESNFLKKEEDLFQYEMTVDKDFLYSIILNNKYGKNRNKIEHTVKAIPDEYPAIQMKQVVDSTFLTSVWIGGSITDDYGFSKFYLKYRINGEEKTNKFKTLKLPFDRSSNAQSFLEELPLITLQLSENQEIEYYLELWDNDQINGFKKVKTQVYKWKFPSKEERQEKLEKTTNKTENALKESYEEAKNISDKLKNLSDKIKGKRKLSWQNKKEIEEIEKENKKLINKIDSLRTEQEIFRKQAEKLDSEGDKKIAEKAKELQKMMEELLDEETKKLYEELEKLLQENVVNNQLQETLQKLTKKQESIEKELDRALNLFKKLKIEAKANKIASKLEDLSEKQEKLKEKTEGASKDKMDKIGEEQKDISESVNKMKEELKSLDEMVKESNTNFQTKDLDEEFKELQKLQEEAINEINKEKKEPTLGKQEESQKKMKKMSQKLQDQLMQMQQQSLEIDHLALRKTLERLIEISYEQEDILKGFKNIRVRDPEYIDLSKKQLQMVDKAKAIEDTLFSLSKDIFQIQSFVTKESTKLNEYLAEGIELTKEKKPSLASVKQQFAMTSMNNLAIMISDILDQMQQEMNSSSSASGKKKPNNNASMPKLSDMQKQLREKLEQMKKSGKGMPQMTKEIAKMAAEQEMIRKAMEEEAGENQSMKGKGQKNNYQEMIEEMKKTEEELLNKNITQETINRQQKIITRMLEAEKASQKRGEENKREAKAAEEKSYADQVPNEFSDYIRKKKQQVEILQKIPVSLNPYYKSKVNEYFNRVSR